MLYFSCVSSFISTQFFIVNLDGWFGVLSKKIIIFWYSIIKLRSSIILCLSSGDIYLSLGIIMLICSCLWIILLWSFCDFTVVQISYGVSNFITNQLRAAVFWITLFELVLSASYVDCLAWSKRFWLYLPLTFLLIFLPIFLPIFLAKDKNRSLSQIFNLQVELNSTSSFIF